ncbi:hypothetical protein OIU78_001755, partial [Salix suchowensis]
MENLRGRKVEGFLKKKKARVRGVASTGIYTEKEGNDAGRFVGFSI